MKRGTLWQFEVVKYIIIGLLFFIALIVSKNHVFMYTTTKSLLMISGSLTALLFYLWGRGREKASKFLFATGDIILFLFGGVLVLSSVYAYVPHFSFFGDFAGMSTLLIISGIILALLIAFLLRRQIFSIQTLLWVSIVSALVVVCTIWNSVLKMGSDNDGGSIGNSSYAGAYLLVNLFFALALVLIEKKRGAKILAGLVGIAIILSPIFFNLDIFKGRVSFDQIISNPLLLSGVANGAVLGIVVGIIASLGVWWTHSQKSGLKLLGTGLIIVLFVSLWSGGQALVNPDSRLHQAYVAQKNANRFVFWDIAYAGMNDRPLLGWGINGYSYVFQKYFDPVLYTPGHAPELWTDNPHNMMAEYAVNTGVIGLIVYLAVIGSSAILLFIQSRSEDKTKKIVGILFFGALVGYVVQDLFVFDTVAPLMMFFLVIGFALTAQEFVSFTISVPQRNLKNLAIAILILISLWLIYQGSILPWKESKITASRIKSNEILSIPSPQNISRMGYADDSAFLATKFMGPLLLPPVQELNQEQKEITEETIGVLIKDINLDEKIDGVPSFRAEWVKGQYLSRLYEISASKTSKINDAHEAFMKALKINPNNPLIYLDIAQDYVIHQEHNESLKWIRVAIALAPQDDTIYQYANQFIDQKIATPEFEQYVKFMSQKWCAPARIECIK